MPDTAARQSYTRWGPFSPAISHSELLCRLQVLRMACQVYVPHPDGTSPIMDALKQAEDGDQSSLEAALIEFDRLPALTIRKILASYAEHWKYQSPKNRKVKGGKGSAGGPHN